MSSTNAKRKAYVLVSIDVPQITIEHILPINSTTNKDNKKSTKLKHSLGNLTLLYKTTNSQIGNSCFKDKKEYYKSQNLLITQELTNYKKWNNKTIKNRIKRILILVNKSTKGTFIES